MNAMILNGSMRKDGRTAAVTSSVKKFLVERGIGANEHFLYQMGIKGCLTCGCGTGKDNATELVKELILCDIPIFASPIRMERTTDSLNAFIELLFHTCRYDDETMDKVKNKKAAVVLTTDGDIDTAAEALELFRELFSRLGMDFVSSLTVPFADKEKILSHEYQKKIKDFVDAIAI